MKKIILITGPAESGKTLMAKKIANQYSKDEVVFINRRWEKELKSPWMFSECTENTKMIVFDNLNYPDLMEELCLIVSNPITVNRKGYNPISITPKIILVFDSETFAEQFITRTKNHFEIIKFQLGSHVQKFTCRACGHELPMDFNVKTEGFCYLCDPNLPIEELLTNK